MPFGKKTPCQWIVVGALSVGHVDAHTIAFDRLDGRTVHATVVSPGSSLQPGCELVLYLFGSQACPERLSTSAPVITSPVGTRWQGAGFQPRIGC
jgi:hypothetical protein